MQTESPAEDEVNDSLVEEVSFRMSCGMWVVFLLLQAVISSPCSRDSASNLLADTGRDDFVAEIIMTCDQWCRINL